MKPLEEGAVCLFTLKNPSFPDYICMTDSAVMCVDTHPKYPYMVVIGLYDGSVKVYNVQATCKQPAFRSNNVTNKHRGIVWEVCRARIHYKFAAVILNSCRLNGHLIYQTVK
jgi:dynein intermediate chain 1